MQSNPLTLHLPLSQTAPAIQSIGKTNCGITDYSCICKDSAFVNGLTSAIQKDCNADEAQRSSLPPFSSPSPYRPFLPPFSPRFLSAYPTPTTKQIPFMSQLQNKTNTWEKKKKSINRQHRPLNNGRQSRCDFHETDLMLIFLQMLKWAFSGGTVLVFFGKMWNFEMLECMWVSLFRSRRKKLFLIRESGGANPHACSGGVKRRQFDRKQGVKIAGAWCQSIKRVSLPLSGPPKKNQPQRKISNNDSQRWQHRCVNVIRSKIHHFNAQPSLIERLHDDMLMWCYRCLHFFVVVVLDFFSLFFKPSNHVNETMYPFASGCRTDSLCFFSWCFFITPPRFLIVFFWFFRCSPLLIHCSPLLLPSAPCSPLPLPHMPV